MRPARCSPLPSANDLAEAVRVLRTHGFRAVPVVDGRLLVGMVVDRDLLALFASASSKLHQRFTNE